MSEPFSIDLISDLNLSETSHFDWTGKATSLFCVVAGNISSNLSVVKRVLEHLGDCYRGVFYIDGPLEHQNLTNYENQVIDIKRICSEIESVVYLHNHVIILNGYAFVGCNGWYGNREVINARELQIVEDLRMTDLAYLSNSIRRLREHQEVKNIIMVTNSIPTEYLSYSSPKLKFPEKLGPGMCLLLDEGNKVSHWVFGTTELEIDTILNNRHYCNNPNQPLRPYWPKRVVINQ
jgi:hypothetical protein